MGFPTLSHLNQTPFFQNAIQQNKVASGVFAFYLAESRESELHLGGTNPQRYSGPIEYHPVINSEFNGKSEIAFWQLGDGEIDVNGKHVSSSIMTIIDSGTTLMYGPVDEVEKIYAQVPGSKALSGAYQDFYSFPCNNVPKISFKWGCGKAWTISK